MFLCFFLFNQLPSETSRKLVHSMCLLIDPLCFNGTVKKCDFPFHVFSSTMDVHPIIRAGDVVRVHRAKAEPRELKTPDFRVFSEKNIVIFRMDANHFSPVPSSQLITLTEYEVTYLKKLQDWYTKQFPKTSSTSIEPHLITLSVISCI